VLVVDPDQRRAATVAGVLNDELDARQAGSAEEALTVAHDLPQLEAVVIHQDAPSSDGLDPVGLLSESTEFGAVPKIVVATRAEKLGRCQGTACSAYIVEADATARAELARFTIALLRASEALA
jgi:CheY-like chemotaxis protein